MDAQSVSAQSGRGRVRGVGNVAARRVFEEVFAGRLGDLELGALLATLRMRGESPVVLRAALDALTPWLRPVEVNADCPVVAIPSYGRARSSANLLPLLACLLADEGVQVVVHAAERDDRGGGTVDVWRAMGLDPIGAGMRAQAAIARGIPALVPVSELSPPLARLLDLRARLGLRNIGHTLANLLNPTDSPACLQLALTAATGFSTPVHRHFQDSGRSALVTRGAEGEAVAGTRGSARIDWIHGGRIEVLVPASNSVPLDAPQLPPARDAAATARWIQSVLAGERPVPPSIERQVAAVFRALAAQASARSTATA